MLRRLTLLFFLLAGCGDAPLTAAEVRVQTFDRVLDYVDPPVIVLVDEATASASDRFALMIKNLSSRCAGERARQRGSSVA